jgi:hypothetical protein
MSIVTNNKFKSTSIYGVLNVVNSVDGNIISNTNLSGNLTVGGKFNSIPVDTIAYISNLTSDVQAQINTKANTTDLTTSNNNITTLQNKTTDIIYTPLTLTTSLINNLIVSGNINNISYSKFGFLTNITSDIQTQINTKAPISSPTFTGTVNGITATMVGLSNVNNTTDLLKPISTATLLAFTTTNNNITTLQTKTTDITYSLLTTTYNNNVIVNGNINNISYAKFGFLTNITSDIQAQISGSGGLTNNNIWTGTNAYNTNIPTTTLTPTLSAQFITKSYADANYAGNGILTGNNIWFGTNAYNTSIPTTTLTPLLTTHFTTKAYTDLKAPLASPTFTGTVNGITATMVGLSNVNNTTDLLKPISTATQTALN